ncbi:MAG: hypothetical protein ACI9S8_002878 [Chlamydiales bacterium]|jgi:hypothetical protein
MTAAVQENEVRLDIYPDASEAVWDAVNDENSSQSLCGRIGSAVSSFFTLITKTFPSRRATEEVNTSQIPSNASVEVEESLKDPDDDYYVQRGSLQVTYSREDIEAVDRDEAWLADEEYLNLVKKKVRAKKKDFTYRAAKTSEYALTIAVSLVHNVWATIAVSTAQAFAAYNANKNQIYFGSIWYRLGNKQYYRKEKRVLVKRLGAVGVLRGVLNSSADVFVVSAKALELLKDTISVPRGLVVKFAVTGYASGITAEVISVGKGVYDIKNNSEAIHSANSSRNRILRSEVSVEDDEEAKAIKDGTTSLLQRVKVYQGIELAANILMLLARIQLIYFSSFAMEKMIEDEEFMDLSHQAAKVGIAGFVEYIIGAVARIALDKKRQANQVEIDNYRFEHPDDYSASILSRDPLALSNRTIDLLYSERNESLRDFFTSVEGR